MSEALYVWCPVLVCYQRTIKNIQANGSGRGV